ncbi:MAG: TldD/PmbA family protein [Candidatus Bathyarchaeia archaeon]
MNPSELLETMRGILVKTEVEEAVALARGVEAWMRRFAENRITVSKSWRLVDGAVYLIDGKRSLGFEISNLQPEAVEKAIKHAVRSLKIAPESDVKPILYDGPTGYGEESLGYDPEILELAYGSVDMVEEAVNAASREGANKTSGVLTFGRGVRLIYTTTGCEGSEQSTFIEFSVRSFYDEESTGQSVRCGSSVRDVNASEMGEEAGRTAWNARNPQKGKPGVYDVVFKPCAMANLLNSVAESASAYAAEIGLSYFKGLKGAKVAADNVTLWDDPRNPRSPVISLFDDEGRPTHRFSIIENGVLKSYLHTSKTAQRLGEAPTGSAYFSTSVGDMVPAARTLIMDPGDVKEDELIGEVGKGVLIHNLWYTRFQNYTAGDFSTMPRDGVFMVRGGEVAEPLKGLRLSDNMVRLLSTIRRLSAERRWVKWWEVNVPVLTPSCLVGEVRLTKPTK